MQSTSAAAILPSSTRWSKFHPISAHSLHNAVKVVKVLYRFEVAVDDLLSVQHLQTSEKSVREATDESQTEALEVVFFDELVQVHPARDKEQTTKV